MQFIYSKLILHYRSHANQQQSPPVLRKIISQHLVVYLAFEQTYLHSFIYQFYHEITIYTLFKSTIYFEIISIYLFKKMCYLKTKAHFTPISCEVQRMIAQKWQNISIMMWKNIFTLIKETAAWCQKKMPEMQKCVSANMVGIFFWRAKGIYEWGEGSIPE